MSLNLNKGLDIMATPQQQQGTCPDCVARLEREALYAPCSVCNRDSDQHAIDRAGLRATLQRKEDGVRIVPD